MPKSRFEQISESHRLEYQRLFAENNNLKKDLRDLREKLDVLPTDSTLNLVRWIENNLDKYIQFEDELKAIAEKHGIHSNWQQALYELAITGKNRQTTPAGDSFLPLIRVRMDENGTKTREIILPPTVDLNDKAVIDFIQYQQKKSAGPIPHPIPIPDHPKGKLDWRPVKEYKLKHPWITHKEIASELGYSETHVRQKFAET